VKAPADVPDETCLNCEEDLAVAHCSPVITHQHSVARNVHDSFSPATRD
jgi:hypothetical protein